MHSRRKPVRFIYRDLVGASVVVAPLATRRSRNQRREQQAQDDWNQAFHQNSSRSRGLGDRRSVAFTRTTRRPATSSAETPTSKSPLLLCRIPRAWAPTAFVACVRGDPVASAWGILADCSQTGVEYRHASPIPIPTNRRRRRIRNHLHGLARVAVVCEGADHNRHRVLRFDCGVCDWHTACGSIRPQPPNHQARPLPNLRV